MFEEVGKILTRIFGVSIYIQSLHWDMVTDRYSMKFSVGSTTYFMDFHEQVLTTDRLFSHAYTKILSLGFEPS